MKASPTVLVPLCLCVSAVCLPAAADWPPPGTAVPLPVTRDTWVSEVGRERLGNNGGSSRMKLKGRQEMSIFDIDTARLRGRIIHGALWHVRSASTKAPLRRVTVSTLASPFVEGTGSGYARQAGSSCFAQAQLGRRDWSVPGSTLMDVAYGGGRTIWRFAEASGPDRKGWQAVAIDPDVVAARAAGLSYGFATYDDVGSEWSYRGGKFTYHTFPNRFLFSREQAVSKPWVQVWVGGRDEVAPQAVTGVEASVEGLPAGEAMVSWITPADAGGGKTLGFRVTFGAPGKAAKPVPRWLIPFAGKPGKRVRMHLAGLPLAPGAAVTLAISAVDSAGNTGPAVRKTIRVSDAPRAITLPDPGVEPFAPSTKLPAAGPLKVAVVDLLDKISPADGKMIPPKPAGYVGGNHLWSAAAKTIRLHAARNEAVCFQVNLAGSARRARATLRFDAAEAVKAKVERFDYVHTKAGILPDVIVPLSAGGAFAVPFADDPEAAGAKNVSLLCEAYVGRTAKAGVHKGRLMIEADGGSLEVDVVLTVWDFTLPDKLSFLAEMNCYNLAEPTPKGLEYYRCAHEHRLCLNRLYYNWKGQPSRAPRPAVDGFDWSRWDKEYAPLLDGSAFADLPRAGEPVDVLYLPLCENWPVPIQPHYRKTYWADSALSDSYRRQLTKAFADFARHLGRKKWRDTIFQFYLNNKVYHKREGWNRTCGLWVFDEPVNTQDFWALRWYGKAWQEAIAGVAADQPMRTAQVWYRADVSYGQFGRGLLADVVDITYMGGADPQKVRMARERALLHGGGVHIQYGTANDPAAANTQPALWCLRAWCGGAVGVLPWQTVGAVDKLAKGAATGLFIDAGNDKSVVPSVRVKAFRRGQQDVEYLTLLGDVTGTPPFAVAATVRKRIDLAGTLHKAYADDAGTTVFDKAGCVELWRLRVAAGAAVSAGRPPYRRCVRPIEAPRRNVADMHMNRYVRPAPDLPASGPDMD